MSETDDPERKWTEGIDPALTRYWYDDGMQPDPSGEWVKWADVRALFTPEEATALDHFAEEWHTPEDYALARSAIAKIRALLPA